jgi:hypothetical protein
MKFEGSVRQAESGSDMDGAEDTPLAVGRKIYGEALIDI